MSSLLAPLVLIAAYVFLGLSAEGISVHVAQLLAGATLSVLYSVLAARLRSHAYLFLALAAAAVAWFGALDQLSIDTWRGPALAPLAGGYALVMAWSRRVPWLGETFARRVILFVHGAAFVALGSGARHTVVSGTWQPWVVTVTLAEIGAAYISLAAAASMAWAWPVGASVLLVAGAGAATDAGLAAWRGLAIGLLGLPAAFVARRAHSAWPAIHAAVVLGLQLVSVDVGRAGSWLPWRVTAAVAAATIVYAAASALDAGRTAELPGMVAFGLAWVLAVHDLGAGMWRDPVDALLTGPYLLAAKGARAPRLRAVYPWLVHGVALVAVSLTTLDSPLPGGLLDWLAAATYGVLGLAYLALTNLRESQLATRLALCGLGLAAAAAVAALGLGHWEGIAVAALGVAYAAAGHAMRHRGAVAARHLLHVAAAASLLIGIRDMVVAPTWLPWHMPEIAAVVTLAYLVAALLGGGADVVVTGAVAFGLTWVLVADDVGAGAWRGALDAVLVLVYGLAGHVPARVGQIRRWLRATWVLLVDAAGVVALTQTLGFSVAAPPRPSALPGWSWPWQLRLWRPASRAGRARPSRCWQWR